MARRKKPAPREQREPVANDPMDTIAAFTAFADKANENEPEPEVNPAEAKAKDLEARIAALTAQIDTLERANTALSQTPAAIAGPKMPEPPPELSLQGLPDPTIQPEEYGKALNERIAAHTKAHFDYQQEVQAINSQAEGDNRKRYDELWEDFAIKFDDYADDQQRVQIAAGQVLDRARSRGIDIQRYVFANREKFFQDVIREFDDLFGGGPDGSPDEPVTRGQPMRTGGIMSGSGSSGVPKGKGGGGDQASTLTAELQAEQRKMRLF